MKITRLSWAGLMLETDTTTLYIDPLQNVADMAFFLGEPKFPIFPVPLPKAHKANVLITHIHQDHFDKALLLNLLTGDGELWGPDPVCVAALKVGIRATVAELYEPIKIGDFKITALPAVDWVGDEQISYLISDGKTTVFHGGDTNWHGYWWKFAQKYGPITAAFLPVNGVVGAVPQVLPVSDMAGTMNPMEAVTATRLLGAKVLVPMHYAQFNNPPQYSEFVHIEKALDESAAQQHITVLRLQDGETIEMP